jgi:hypothetical protein
MRSLKLFVPALVLLLSVSFSARQVGAPMPMAAATFQSADAVRQVTEF